MLLLTTGSHPIKSQYSLRTDQQVSQLRAELIRARAALSAVRNGQCRLDNAFSSQPIATLESELECLLVSTDASCHPFAEVW